jgi:hypothetical protein
MSNVEGRIKQLAVAQTVVVSQHAAAQLRKRNILLADIIGGAASGDVIEDYPTFHKGPAVLMLQRDGRDAPLHVVWGLELGTTEPAVIVTAYVPDPSKWSADFRTRKP